MGICMLIFRHAHLESKIIITLKHEKNSSQKFWWLNVAHLEFHTNEVVCVNTQYQTAYEEKLNPIIQLQLSFGKNGKMNLQILKDICLKIINIGKSM